MPYIIALRIPSQGDRNMSAFFKYQIHLNAEAQSSQRCAEKNFINYWHFNFSGSASFAFFDRRGIPIPRRQINQDFCPPTQSKRKNLKHYKSFLRSSRLISQSRKIWASKPRPIDSPLWTGTTYSAHRNDAKNDGCPLSE